jgi:hypothetical protein
MPIRHRKHSAIVLEARRCAFLESGHTSDFDWHVEYSAALVDAAGDRNKMNRLAGKFAFISSAALDIGAATARVEGGLTAQ